MAQRSGPGRDDDEVPFPDDVGEEHVAVDPSRYFAPPADDDEGAEKGEIRTVTVLEGAQDERSERIRRGRERLSEMVSPSASTRAMDALLQEKGGRLLSTLTQALTTRLALARNRIKDDVPAGGSTTAGSGETPHEGEY